MAVLGYLGGDQLHWAKSFAVEVLSKDQLIRRDRSIERMVNDHRAGGFHFRIVEAQLVRAKIHSEVAGAGKRIRQIATSVEVEDMDGFLVRSTFTDAINQ